MVRCCRRMHSDDPSCRVPTWVRICLAVGEFSRVRESGRPYASPHPALRLPTGVRASWARGLLEADHVALRGRLTGVVRG